MEQSNTPTPSSKRPWFWRIYGILVVVFGIFYITFTFVTIFDVNVEVPFIRIVISILYLFIIGIEIPLLKKDFFN